MGKIIGMQMNDKGVDWVLCPAIDMCIDHQMYMEAISDDPQVISQIYRQVVRGIQDQGVCATVKHFPGMGTHFVNMHLAPGSNILPFDELRELINGKVVQLAGNTNLAFNVNDITATRR